MKRYIKSSVCFTLLMCIFSALSGCADNHENSSDIAPDSIAQQSSDEPHPKKIYAKKLSQIYGYWDIIRFDDYEPETLSHDGRDITYVYFENGQVGARLECNKGGMPAKLSRSGVLKKANRSSHFVSTSMGCGDEKNARETIFFNVFRNRPRIEIISPTELRVTSPDHVLLLEKRQNDTAASPQPTLTETENTSINTRSEEALPEGYEALRKQCPEMDDVTLKGILKPSSPNRPDYDYYARSYCVPHDEARRRLALQGEWHSGETGQRVQELITRIKVQEADTFAGHWIQHTPNYGLAVAFTKDAKKTLAKYTDDPKFIPVDISGTDEKTIERNQFRIMAMLKKLDIPYSSANRDYKTGTFLVQLSVDKEGYIRDQAAKGIIDLPDWVRFTAPPPLPRSIPAPALEPERLKAFPQYSHRREFDVQTSAGVLDQTGMLKLVNGCLAFEKDGEHKTILWQKYHAPDLTNIDRVGVMSRYKGPTVFDGEGIIISGLQPGLTAQVKGFNNKPDQWAKVADDTDGACPAPYVMAEGFVSLKEARKDKLDAKVKHYRNTFSMSREEALVEAKKEEALFAELTELLKNLTQSKRDKVAGGWLGPESTFSHVRAGYGNNQPPALSIFVKGAVDKANLIPAHLLDYVHVQTAPRSLAEGDKDIARLKEKLGDSADIGFNPYDGSIAIENIRDLKPLSSLKAAMGQDWPEHYKISIENEAAKAAYFGPRFVLGRYNLQQRPEYQEILDYAESKFPKQNYHMLDQAVLILMSYGLMDLEAIERLENRGYGPLTAELDYQAPSRKIKEAIFAEAIVTAEPIEINTADDRGDGYKSTVTFRVKSYIKGGLNAGETFQVRLKSGEDENGYHVKTQSEPFLLPGFHYGFADHKDWILFLSHRAYQSKINEADHGSDLLWILSGRAMPMRDDKYTWFGETLTPAQMRERIKNMDTPENIITYVNSLPRPKKGVCSIHSGIPKEGLGVPIKEDDVYNLNLTEKGQSLGCDHEGPQRQFCIIEDGGYITWLEGGQRRHITAQGGYVGVVINGSGARCQP